MRRFSAFVPLVLLPVLLVGCGGSDDDGGCGTDTGLHSNADYAGSYDVTFTPAVESPGEFREFRLSVLADGTISGVVRDPVESDTYGGNVTGTVRETNDGCGDGQTYVTLDYTLADGRTGEFEVQRDSDDAITGTYPIDGEGDDVDGSLQVERTVVSEL